MEEKFDEAVRGLLRAYDFEGLERSCLMTIAGEKVGRLAESLRPKTPQTLPPFNPDVVDRIFPCPTESIARWDEYLAKELGPSPKASPPVMDPSQPLSSSSLPPAVMSTRNNIQPSGSGLNVNALKANPLASTRHPSNPTVTNDEEFSVRSNSIQRYQAPIRPLPSNSWSTRPNPSNHDPARETPSFVSAKSRFQGSTNNVNDRDETTNQGNGFGSARPFKPPTKVGDPPSRPNNARQNSNNHSGAGFTKAPVQNAAKASEKKSGENEENVHPRLRGIDPELIERIENEILESGQPVTFDDIAGLTFAKQCIEEMVVWPVRNPEFYTGLRQLPKGLLLFGPPGTGKTVLGKAIAHECKATFFSISASSLTSKWIGEGEKMVRALFAVAAVRQPSVVFIDEIDSLLTQRSSDENEASRRIKTEFLVQFDGAATGQDDVVLIIGATNRPQELDEAARRRFVRRLYVPLPDAETRSQLLNHLLKKNENSLTPDELEDVAKLTSGYSGADVTNLAREASMVPLREVLRGAQKDKLLRPICRKDFDIALKSVKASVSNMDLASYIKWNEEFGTQQYSGE